jgi:type I restriction enzyme M protein
MVYTLTRQEDKYMAKVKGMKKEAVYVSSEIFGRLMNSLYVNYGIYDVLGVVYQEIASRSKSQALGQYFTPFVVCEAMAKMTLGDIKGQIEIAKKEGKRFKVLDPCVGSGAMLLGAKKAIIEEYGLAGLDYFEFYGMDIDPICVNMAKVQMALTDYRYMSDLLIGVAYDVLKKQKA